MPKQLLFPQIETATVPRLLVSPFRNEAHVPFPWQATMLTTVNCYLLWSLSWLQFVTTFSNFTSSGDNLTFYAISGEPLGLSIPESFLFTSIALSAFAISAVVGATFRVPRLWKRLLTVCVFSVIAIGFSCINLHLRHYCYAQALRCQDEVMRLQYQRQIVYGNSTDHSILERLERGRQRLATYDELLRKYRSKYGISSE